MRPRAQNRGIRAARPAVIVKFVCNFSANTAIIRVE